MERPKLMKEFLKHSLEQISEKTNQRLEEKGEGIFVSAHEALGIITEEYNELVWAVQANAKIKNELLDIAVACHVAIASIDQYSIGKV